MSDQSEREAFEATAAPALQPELWHDEKQDQWSPEIEAAHPMKTGAHAEYAMALEMVGNRRSKGALVALVCWLLQRSKAALQPVPRSDTGEAL